MGAFHERASTEKPALVLEGEAAPEAVLVSAAGASNGAFGRFNVSGGNWQAFASWELDYTELAVLGGRLFLPLLRFQTPISAESVRFRAVLSPADASPSLPVFQTPIADAHSGVGFLALSPLAPALWRTQSALRARRAEAKPVQAFIPAAGTHTLEIDDLLLLPQDNFAWFDAPAGIAVGARLMDDSFARESYTVVDGQQLRAHKRVGAWFELPAGARSWFYCFQVDANGAALPSAAIGVRAWCRSRRQIL